MTMCPVEARDFLRDHKIDPRVDFHALRSEQVERLTWAACVYGYRKPRLANGSTARYFHAYLVRKARS